MRRVGVTQLRYVSHQHLSPWLVHSYKNVKGRKTDTDKKTVPLEPFIFEEVDGDASADSGDEAETLCFNVPPAPQGETLLAERLPPPPADKLRVLSLVRSAILEEKEPGGEGESDDTQVTSDDQGKQTDKPAATTTTSSKEPFSQTTQPDKDKDEQDEYDQDDQLVPDIDTSDEEEANTPDATPTVPLPAKTIEKAAAESNLVPDAATKEKVVAMEEGEGKEGKKSPVPADLAVPESVEWGSADGVPPTTAQQLPASQPATTVSALTVPGATVPATTLPGTTTVPAPQPGQFTSQPRCRVRLPKPSPSATPHVRLGGVGMGPRLRMPAVKVLNPPATPRPAVQVIHPPPPRPLAATTTTQGAGPATTTSSVTVQIQPTADAIVKTSSGSEARASFLAAIDRAVAKPRTNVQDLVGAKLPQCKRGAKPRSGTKSTPEPQPTTMGQSAVGPKPTESIIRPEMTSTIEVGAKPISSTEAVAKPITARSTDTAVKSTLRIAAPTVTSDGKPEDSVAPEKSSAKESVATTATAVSVARASTASSVASTAGFTTLTTQSVPGPSSTASVTSMLQAAAASTIHGDLTSWPVVPSAPGAVRGSPISPTVRHRRMSESMALYKNITVNPEDTPDTSTITPQRPARIRKISLGESSAPGTPGMKVTRIPSILSTRGLPSLESMSSRRVRTASECSDGKTAEPQGTMLQLLEGITGGTTTQTQEEPMEVTDTESGPQAQSRASVPSSPVVRSLLGRESMVHSPQMTSPRAKSGMDLHASPVQSALRSPVASTSRSPMPSPIMSPRTYSGLQAMSSASQRSPRALTNQAILDMLNEADPPSIPVPNPVLSPRSAKSSALLAALHSPPLYAPMQTSPFTSPTRTSPGASPQRNRPPFMFSSTKPAPGGPAVQKLTFSEPSPAIRELLKTPSVQRLSFPQPLPMCTPSSTGAQAVRPRAQTSGTSLAGRRGASVSVSTGRIGQLGGQSIRIPTPQPMQVISEPSKSSKDVDTFIEVPVDELPGFENVKHIIQKGPQNTVRVKLPAGYKLPPGQGQVRFSIVSEDEARKMGIAVPKAAPSSSATGVPPQRAPTPGSHSPAPPAAAAATVPAAPATSSAAGGVGPIVSSHQSLAASLGKPTMAAILNQPPMTILGQPSMTQQSMATSLSQQSNASSMTQQSMATSLSQPSPVSATMSQNMTQQSKAPGMTPQSVTPTMAPSRSPQPMVSSMTQQSLAPTMAQQSLATTMTQQSLATTSSPQPVAPSMSPQPKASSMTQQSLVSSMAPQSVTPTMGQQSVASTSSPKPVAPSMTQQSLATVSSPKPVAPSMTQQSLAPTMTQQSLATVSSPKPVAPSMTQQSLAPTMTQQSLAPTMVTTSAPQPVAPSMSYPSTAGSLMSPTPMAPSRSQPSRSTRRSMPGNQSGQSTASKPGQSSVPVKTEPTAPQPKPQTRSTRSTQPRSTQPRKKKKGSSGDTVPQLDGAGDSDDEKPSTSSVPPQLETPEEMETPQEEEMPEQSEIPEQPETPQQPPPRIKHSSAGRYSTFPKYKGQTPESSFHKLYQSVRLIPRPWRQTDGLVNKPTLKLMLESVLILIMSRPGITEDDVTAQYNPILQPVPVRELLEMLEDIGCIHRLNIVSSHKPTLFSSRVQLSLELVDVFTGVQKLGSLKTYIPAVDCVLKLGQFEAQLTSAMSHKMREALETEHAAAMNPAVKAAMSRRAEAQVEKKMATMTSRELEEMAEAEAAAT